MHSSRGNQTEGASLGASLIAFAIGILILLFTVWPQITRASAKQGLTLEMPLPCVKRVVFLDCRPDNISLNCKKAVVDHTKGCEVIVNEPNSEHSGD